MSLTSGPHTKKVKKFINQKIPSMTEKQWLVNAKKWVKKHEEEKHCQTGSLTPPDKEISEALDYAWTSFRFTLQKIKTENNPLWVSKWVAQEVAMWGYVCDTITEIMTPFDVPTTKGKIFVYHAGSPT